MRAVEVEPHTQETQLLEVMVVAELEAMLV
jgi:hypothetical protein